MKILPSIRAPITYSIVLSMLLLGIQAPVQADSVSTQALTMQVELQLQRDDVRDLIAREEVRDALLGYGVSLADVDYRIDNLTTGELLQLENRLAELPAGGSIGGAILGIILIFVLLDLLGATDVFPRI